MSFIWFTPVSILQFWMYITSLPHHLYSLKVIHRLLSHLLHPLSSCSLCYLLSYCCLGFVFGSVSQVFPPYDDSGWFGQKWETLHWSSPSDIEIHWWFWIRYSFSVLFLGKLEQGVPNSLTRASERKSASFSQSRDCEGLVQKTIFKVTGSSNKGLFQMTTLKCWQKSMPP